MENITKQFEDKLSKNRKEYHENIFKECLEEVNLLNNKNKEQLKEAFIDKIAYDKWACVFETFKELEEETKTDINKLVFELYYNNQDEIDSFYYEMEEDLDVSNTMMGQLWDLVYNYYYETFIEKQSFNYINNRLKKIKTLQDNLDNNLKLNTTTKTFNKI